MRLRTITTLFTVAVLACAATAGAQQREGRQGGPPEGRPGGFGGRGGFFPGMGGGGFGFSRLMLLRIPEVQKELELADEQVAALRQLADEMRGPGGPGGPGGFRGRPGGEGGEGGGRRGNRGGDNPNQGALRVGPATLYFVQQDQEGQGRRGNFQPPSEEDRARMEQERLERTRQENAKLGEILLPHQMTRLREIYIRVAGVAALQDEEVSKELGVSDSQKAQMVKIRDEAREATMAMFRDGGGGGDRDAMRAKMEEQRKETESKVLAVLTAQQKQKFEELKGKPFTLPEGAMRFGGPGGPGGRGPGGDSGNRPRNEAF